MGTKLTGAIILVLAMVTVVGFWRTSSNEREKLLSAKERAATMVTELFCAGVMAPLSFSDDTGVSEHISLLIQNTNVLYVAVWRAEAGGRRGEKVAAAGRDMRAPNTSLNPRGAPILSNVESTHAFAEANHGLVSDALPSQLEIRRESNAVIVEKPVVAASGEVLGAVLLKWSLMSEKAAIADEQRNTLLTFLLTAVGVAIVVIVLSRTLVVQRLAELANAAKRLEQGEVVEIQLESNDEVGALSRAFASMSEAIANRETEISQRNRDLRRVLDNVAEGLVSVKKDGTMSDERSRAVDQWFGAPPPGIALSDYFQTIAPATADLLRLGWMALNDDMMPVEVVIDQMRARFEYKQRSYELDFSPIWLGTEDNQIIDEILVVVRDVTAVVEGERAEQAQREALKIFRRILADPGALREFLRNGSRLVEAIEQGQGSMPTPRLRRDIHTLKGDTALYGIESVASVCHRIESRLQETADHLTADDVTALRAAWQRVLLLAVELETGAGNDRIEIHIREYEEHLAQLSARRYDDALISAVRRWTYEPAKRSLQRLAEQARSLAQQIGKGETAVDVRITPPTLRLSPTRWAPLWSVFSHVLRNTLDHGIETVNERLVANKKPSGRVELALTVSHKGLAFSVTDDGRGIDWEKVRQRASRLGLPHETRAELEEALYADQVTTKDHVTELSGRGVGMGAVREVIRHCGGVMTVDTRVGVGTTITCLLPLKMLDETGPPSVEPKVA